MCSKSIIMLSPNKKVVLPEPGKKYAQIYKTVQNKCVGRFWCDRTTVDSLFYWRKNCYGLRSIFWHLFRTFSLHNMLNDELEWCKLLVDYCDIFISCLYSHSDGTHSLQRIGHGHMAPPAKTSLHDCSRQKWGWVTAVAVLIDVVIYILKCIIKSLSFRNSDSLMPCQMCLHTSESM